MSDDVMIAVDPHKASNTAAVRNRKKRVSLNIRTPVGEICRYVVSQLSNSASDSTRGNSRPRYAPETSNRTASMPALRAPI